MAAKYAQKKEDDPLLTLARAYVAEMLKLTHDQAETDNYSVTDEAALFWRLHYEKTFYYALAVKSLPPAKLERDRPVLEALARVLGRAAHHLAERDGETKISEHHAQRACEIVDCPTPELRVDLVAGERAEWCN